MSSLQRNAVGSAPVLLVEIVVREEWAQLDLNRRPADYESAALTN